MPTKQQPGLHPLAKGAYAWLAPSGGWGWSNAGLIVDEEESLLVDTLYDLELTGKMLRKMRAAEPATHSILTLMAITVTATNWSRAPILLHQRPRPWKWAS